MPALATLEDLNKVLHDLREFKEKYPDACLAICAILRQHRAVGFKNLCKLLLDEATPEKLKGMD